MHVKMKLCLLYIHVLLKKVSKEKAFLVATRKPHSLTVLYRRMKDLGGYGQKEQFLLDFYQ